MLVKFKNLKIFGREEISADLEEIKEDLQVKYQNWPLITQNDLTWPLFLLSLMNIELTNDIRYIIYRLYDEGVHTKVYK